MNNCLHCGQLLQRQTVGRAPSYCSNACRQSHYRKNVTLRNAGDSKNHASPAFDVHQTMSDIGIDIKDFEQRPKDYQIYFTAQLLSSAIPFDVLMHAFIISFKLEEEKRLKALDDSLAVFKNFSF